MKVLSFKSKAFLFFQVNQSPLLSLRGKGRLSFLTFAKAESELEYWAIALLLPPKKIVISKKIRDNNFLV